MKKLFVGFFVIFSLNLVSYSQPIIIQGECDKAVYFDDNGMNKSVEIYFRINNQCKKDTFLTIDVSIFIVPDRFLILDGITRELILDTGWIGCQSAFLLPEQLDSCTNGFVFVTPQFTQFMGSNYPQDFYFSKPEAGYQGNYSGWGRIKIPTSRDLFIIKVLPNQFAPTIGYVYINCVSPTDSLCTTIQSDTIVNCWTDADSSSTALPSQVTYYTMCCDSIVNYTYVDKYLIYHLEDTFICLGEEVLLENPVPDSMFTNEYWSNGMNADHIVSPTFSQIYNLYVQASDCVWVLPKRINVEGENLNQLDKKISLLETDEYFELNLCELEKDWLFFCDGIQINCDEKIYVTGEETLIITFQSKETGCLIDIRFILNALKNRQIFIPNIFSPNYDGINDVFQIFGADGYIKEIKYFKIFDRWGNLLHNSKNDFWDGTSNGKALSSGTYIYLIEISNFKGECQVFKGSVTIII